MYPVLVLLLSLCLSLVLDVHRLYLTQDKRGDGEMCLKKTREVISGIGFVVSSERKLIEIY